MKKIILLLFLLAFCNSTFYLDAHPVIWKNGQVLMTELDENMVRSTYHKSFAYNWSIGGHYLYSNDVKNSFFFGQSNWLVMRWNAKKSQGNIYFLTGLGLETSFKSKEIKTLLGVQGDWETRRFYTFFKLNRYVLERENISLRARLGVSPWESQFNDLHTWFMVQLDTSSQDDWKRVKVIPILRVFKHDILGEIGSDFEDYLFLTFMLHL